MESAAAPEFMAGDDEGLVRIVEREESRLRRFIRRRVDDLGDAEDVLQDVFYRLVEANRLLMPIDHVAAWLFTVARNRIADLFRQKGREDGSAPEERRATPGDDDEWLDLADLVASPDPEPDAVYAQRMLVEELAIALEELPEEQREVFVANEIDGRTFKEIAAETGVSINTLLSRKRYAVARLRERLQEIHEEFKRG